MERNAPKSNLTDLKEKDTSGRDSDLDVLNVAKEALTRRRIFGAGATGLMAAIVAACSNGATFSDKKSARRPGAQGEGEGNPLDQNDGEPKQTEKPPAVESKSQDSATVAPENGNMGPTVEEKTEKIAPCDPPRTTKLTVTADPATGDLIPVIRLYGSAADTSMLAIGFTTDKAILNLTLLHEDGTLIALHGINGGDKAADGKYRPIVIDNLNLKNKSKVRLLITLADKRYLHDITVSYFTTYNNKPVKDLGAHSIPAGFLGNQSVAQIGEGINFLANDAYTYPDINGNEGARSLRTAQLTSTWVRGAGILGTVTDILGNPLALVNGALLEHQTFCTYVETADTAYRTMIRVG